MNEQLNQEENNTLKHEDILEVFEKLIKYLRLAKKNLRKNHRKMAFRNYYSRDRKWSKFNLKFIK